MEGKGGGGSICRGRKGHWTEHLEWEGRAMERAPRVEGRRCGRGHLEWKERDAGLPKSSSEGPNKLLQMAIINKFNFILIVPGRVRTFVHPPSAPGPRRAFGEEGGFPAAGKKQ